MCSLKCVDTDTRFLKLLVFLFIATTFDISLVLYNLNLRQYVITETASNELSLNYIKTNTRVRYRLCMTISMCSLGKHLFKSSSPFGTQLNSYQSWQNINKSSILLINIAAFVYVS